HPDKRWGNKWEITGGSVVAGETSLEGAVRELFEETGIKISKNQLDYCSTITSDFSIKDLYLYEADFSEIDIVLQDGETIEYKLVTPEELYAMKQRGEFLDFIYDRIKAIVPDKLKLKENIVEKIHHVSIKTTSKEKLEEAIYFYCDILGFSVFRKWETGVLIDTRGGYIEIMLAESPLDTGLIKHFALGTSNVDGCVKLVEKHGYNVFIQPNDKTIMSDPPVELRMAFMVGPLGEQIEFFHQK
ncbi:MAG: NUDIX domain-containing protein, partial [Clostridiales bacterium]|nr:NUDIX domain-containing protein [Clostridiales bacterium]